jgi:CRISPR/Cas system CMR-associated protein Cmr5 small subunit
MAEKTSLDQQRASSAAARIRELHAQSKDFWRGYCGVVDRLPGDIRYSGLLRALATGLVGSQKGRNNDEQRGRLWVLADLAHWFNQFQRAVTGTGDDTFTVPATVEKGQAFINELIAFDARQLQFLQHEAGEYLAWLKLLSAPFKPKDEVERRYVDGEGADSSESIEEEAG